MKIEKMTFSVPKLTALPVQTRLTANKMPYFTSTTFIMFCEQGASYLNTQNKVFENLLILLIPFNWDRGQRVQRVGEEREQIEEQTGIPHLFKFTGKLKCFFQSSDYRGLLRQMIHEGD